MKRAVCLALVVIGCSKREQSPAPPAGTASAPAETVSAPAPVVSAGLAEASPKPSFLRLPVVATNARAAFDGDPFSVATEKGPFEAKLADKRKIKRVRVVGTDVKKVSVSCDGGPKVAADAAEVTLDADARSVTVTVDGGPVAEIELYGDLAVGIATAPADVADRVKQLESKPQAPLRSVEFLASLGVTGAKPGVVESTRSFRAQLDRDSDQEGIVVVTQKERTYFVFYDDDAHGRGVEGTRVIAHGTCDTNEDVQIKAQPVHAEAFSDVVITWKSCDASDPGGMVLTLERGMVETLWTFRSKLELHFGSAFPKPIEMLEGVKVSERHTFDETAFRYR